MVARVSEVYEIRLSPKLTEILRTLIEEAKGQEVVSALFSRTTGDGFIVYRFQVGQKGLLYKELTEEVILPLHVLGFIYAERENTERGNLVLMPQAFDWAAYQQKGKVGKAIYRMWHVSKRNAGVLATALITGITTALAVLQILDLLW